MTIHGYGLAGGRAVRFGGQLASSVTVDSENEITAISPAGRGTVDVDVVTSEGTSAPTSTDKFTYFPSPTVTGVQPNFGPTAGGTQVTITGTNFVGVTGVDFGQTAATNVKVESETKITATAPAGSSTVDVTVTAAGGASARGSADTFAYESTAPPIQSSFGEAGSGAGQLNSPQGVAVDLSRQCVGLLSGITTGSMSSGLKASSSSRSAGASRTARKKPRSAAKPAGPGSRARGRDSSSEPAGIATEGNRVWVVDRANSRVEEFSSAGVYLNRQIVSGSAPFPTAPNDVALDGHGDMFVTGSEYGSLQKFSIETGEQLGQVLTYTNGYSPQQGVAVDRQGNVWVTDGGSNRVREFSNNLGLKLTLGWGVNDGQAKFETCTSECEVGLAGSGNGEFSSPTGLAIDATNTLWVVDSGNNRVEGFTLSGEYLTQFGSAGSGPDQMQSPWGIAATTGTLYASDTGNNRIERWGPLAPVIAGVQPNVGAEAGATTVTITGYGFSGVRSVRFGGTPASQFTVKSETEITATAPAGTGTVDVAVITARGTTATSAADEFTYKRAPTVETKAASFITKTAPATLNGSVNPNGSEVTECKFEYGTTTSYGKTAACTPTPGSGTSTVTVSAEITGLTANTTYHFRVVASNVGGKGEGTDATFKTLPNAPTVETKAASAILQTVATLNGSVNPNGANVSECKFEYGTTTSYGKTANCASLPGAGESPVAVSAVITGLSAKTTYHFRVVATNSSGTSKGSDVTFTTLIVPSFTSSFGTAGSGSGQVKGPAGVAIDSKANAWVADSANNRVDEFSSSGTFIKAFGWGVSNGKAEAQTCATSCKAGLAGSGSGEFKKPWGIAIAPSGEILVSDVENNRIQEFTAEAKFVRQFGSKGTGNGQFSEPLGLAAQSSGNIWVADSANNRVQEFSSEGKYVTQVGSLSKPQGVAVDSSSDVWVVDGLNDRVEELSSTGAFLKTFGWGVTNGKAEAQVCTSSCKAGIAGSGNGKFKEPTGITVDSKGELWVVDGANSRVEEFLPTGEWVISFGAAGSGSGQFSKPWGIGLTGGSAYVADNGNNRIQIWAVSE